MALAIGLCQQRLSKLAWLRAPAPMDIPSMSKENRGSGWGPSPSGGEPVLGHGAKSGSPARSGGGEVFSGGGEEGSISDKWLPALNFRWQSTSGQQGSSRKQLHG
jgi:hypothetical protein